MAKDDIKKITDKIDKYKDYVTSISSLEIYWYHREMERLRREIYNQAITHIILMVIFGCIGVLLGYVLGIS